MTALSIMMFIEGNDIIIHYDDFERLDDDIIHYDDFGKLDKNCIHGQMHYT